jgi:hypothetical protein
MFVTACKGITKNNKTKENNKKMLFMQNNLYSLKFSYLQYKVTAFFACFCYFE